MTENNTFYCSFVGNQYIICECGEAFPSEDELRDHLERDPDNKHTTTFTEYKCGECSKIYATEQECIDHQEIEHMPYTQEEHSYMKDSVEIKQEPEYTTDAQLYVKAEPLFTSPLYVKEEEMYGEEETYFVEPVNKSATVLELVEEETETAPSRVESKPRGRKQAVQVTDGEKKRKNYVHKNVVCEVCGKKYASAAALRYHQRVHTGVRPYQCSYCPKNFTMGLFLQIHVRTHTGERPYQCTQCPKAFSNRAALLRHDRVHSGIKPYECPKCGKTFTQSNSMKLHVHTVHLKMPAPYKSKRRRAESEARARRPKRDKPPAAPAPAHPAHPAHPALPAPAASAEPALVALDQLQIVQAKLEPGQIEETYPELEGEVYYCALPAKHDGVAYELVYE